MVVVAEPFRSRRRTRHHALSSIFVNPSKPSISQTSQYLRSALPVEQDIVKSTAGFQTRSEQDMTAVAEFLDPPSNRTQNVIVSFSTPLKPSIPKTSYLLVPLSPVHNSSSLRFQTPVPKQHSRLPRTFRTESSRAVEQDTTRNPSFSRLPLPNQRTWQRAFVPLSPRSRAPRSEKGPGFQSPLPSPHPHQNTKTPPSLSPSLPPSPHTKTPHLLNPLSEPPMANYSQILNPPWRTKMQNFSPSIDRKVE